MSMAYLAEPDQQQKLEWVDDSVVSILLDNANTDGQLTMGRFTLRKGSAPPYHMHTREDEVFLLIKGTALVWTDDQEMELSEGGIIFLPKYVPHGYRITSDTADLLMICTPGLASEGHPQRSTRRSDNAPQSAPCDRQASRERRGGDRRGYRGRS